MDIANSIYRVIARARYLWAMAKSVIQVIGNETEKKILKKN